MTITPAHAAHADNTLSRIIEAYLDKGLALPAAIAAARKDEPELFAAYVANRRAAKAASGPADDLVEALVRDHLSNPPDPATKAARANAAKATATLDRLVAMSEGAAAQRLAKETSYWCAEHRCDDGSLAAIDRARTALRVTRPDLFRDLAEERS